MSEAIDSFLLELSSTSVCETITSTSTTTCPSLASSTSVSITNPSTNNQDDYHESICAVCETGGALICCMGRCLRSFHLKCIDIQEDQLASKETFHCSDCENKIQRCFACKEFQTESALIKCPIEFCGKYYHANCMGSITNDCRSVCPIHSCGVCHKDMTDSSKRKNTLRCFKCPKSYHLSCRPRDLHSLGQGLFLCIAHVNEQENLPAMPTHLLHLSPTNTTINITNTSEDSTSHRGEDIYFTPGVIVRLDGIRPGTHVFAIKDAIKAVADIRFLEFDERSSDWALARMGDPISAQALVSATRDAKGLCIPFLRAGARASNGVDCSPSYPSARCLTGDEELEYWKKTSTDGKGRRKRYDSLADDRPARRLRSGESSEISRAHTSHVAGALPFLPSVNSFIEANQTVPYLSRTASVLQHSCEVYPTRAIAPHYQDPFVHAMGRGEPYSNHFGFESGFQRENRFAYSGSEGGYYTNQTQYMGRGDSSRALSSNTGSFFGTSDSLSAFPRLASLVNHSGAPPYSAHNRGNLLFNASSGGVYAAPSLPHYYATSQEGDSSGVSKGADSYYSDSYPVLAPPSVNHRGGNFPLVDTPPASQFIYGEDRGGNTSFHTASPGANHKPSHQQRQSWAGKRQQSSPPSKQSKVNPEELFGMLASAGLLPASK